MAKNLFTAAKAKGATAPSKPGKVEVIVNDPNFHVNLARLAEINKQVDELNAEGAILSAEVKERSIKEFSNLYEKNQEYPGSFNIAARGMKGIPPASLMFIPTDKYLKIDESRYNELKETYGEDLVEEKTTYTMNPELIEKYGEILSEAINKIKGIPQEDKEKLISATTSWNIKKGTITKLPDFEATIPEMLEEIKPVYQMKNVKIEED